jgi:pyrroline-5-carboxylate reductase
MIMVTSKKIGIIGGGNMGTALLKGLLQSGQFDANQLMVSDISQQRLQYLHNTYKVSTFTRNEEVATGSDVLILAVKPQQVEDILGQISAHIEHLPLLISVAAGVDIATIEKGLGKPAPVIRVMPNTPALVLAGASAVAGGTYADVDHLAMARVLFESVGLVVDVDESNMDAVTGLSGSGPAYILLFMEALIDAGVLVGLPRQTARDLAVQTTLGAAKLLLDSHIHPGALKDQITSPGGTTIHGLAILESGGIRGMLMQAVAAATERSRELGKK